MKRFKNILCVTVSDSDNKTVVERAAVLAKNNQARLTVVRVISKIPPNLKLPDGALSPHELEARIIKEHEKELIVMVSHWGKDIEMKPKVLVGTPFLEIIREVLRNGRDLVIKTAESGGLLDRVFGSNDMQILRKCPCPVWLVKPNSPKVYQRILAAVDVDNFYLPGELETRRLLNLQILEMSSSLALSESAKLHIVAVWQAIAEYGLKRGVPSISEEDAFSYVESVKERHRQDLNILMDEVASQTGRDFFENLQPQTHLLKGSPRKEIPSFADKIDANLVVMGTVARTGISGFFIGNTAETILNRLKCSVLAIKPPGFETPVTLNG